MQEEEFKSTLKKKLQSENNQTMPAYQFKNQSFKYERGKLEIFKIMFLISNCNMNYPILE